MAYFGSLPAWLVFDNLNGLEVHRVSKKSTTRRTAAKCRSKRGNARPHSPAWIRRLDELKAYKQEHGHCNVPNKYPANPQLSRWVYNLRQLKKRGKLDEKKSRQLEKMGIVWEVLEWQWQKMFSALVKYKKRYGDCDVPNKYPVSPQLGGWVYRLRRLKKRGKLEAAHIKHLDAIGFVWGCPHQGPEEHWDQMYSALVEYKKVHGHCNVSTLSKEYLRLGNWVRTQRGRRRKGTLGNEQIQRLEQIGFAWEILAERWDEMFATLVEYKEAHGNCNVPPDWPENPKFANWVQTQRSCFKSGEIDAKRIGRLSGLGFKWSLRKKAKKKKKRTVVRKQHINHPGKRSYSGVRRLTIKQILAWADAHHERTGKWPITTSGPVVGVFNETWAAIDAALAAGCRGLWGGSTLSRLLRKYRRKKKEKLVA